VTNRPPLVALFSSVQAAGSLILQVHDLAQTWRRQPLTLISGFHAPLEVEVWSVLWPDVVDVGKFGLKSGVSAGHP